MIILIAYFYYDRNGAYIDHVEMVEKDMADILVAEEEYTSQQLNVPPLILDENMNDDLQSLDKSNPHGIEKIILEVSEEGLSHGAIGIYSSKQQKVVFHLGRTDVLQLLNLREVQAGMNHKGKTPFYIELNSKLFYIVPLIENNIVSGYIYSYHVDKQSQTNPIIMVLVLIMAFIIALLGAWWVELKTRVRLEQLKKELQSLQDSGKSLTIQEGHIGEIAQSVNTINENYSNRFKMNKAIMDSIPLGILYYDKSGNVQFVNESAKQITGYSAEEIKKFIVKGNVLGSTQRVFWETLRSGNSFLGFESFCPTKDGKEIPVLTNTEPIYDDSGSLLGIVSSFIDITEQSRLRKVEQRSKTILDSISDGVIAVDNQGIVVSFNHGAEEMTGLKAEQVIGKSYDDFLIKEKPIFTNLTFTLRNGNELFNRKKRIITDNGRAVHLIVSTKLLRNESGKKTGAVGIYKDITPIIELEEQIQRADKMSVIGELAAGTAHEIRNPLTTIQGFIQLLEYDLKGSKHQDYLQIVLKEITHINEIIKEMLLLAKPSAPQMGFVSMNQMIRDTIGFMNAEGLLHNVELRTELEENLPLIELDERQIKQVFMNLIRNSIQAMVKGGEVIIRATLNQDLRIIEVSFTDNGVGISEENLVKIYEPFYTTKDTGTGLGIPISCRIMQSHGGTLNIQSKKGNGTKVTLYFPIERDDSI